MFRQTKYSQEQGTKMGLDTHARKAGMKFYNNRSVEVMNIWKKVGYFVFFVGACSQI